MVQAGDLATKAGLELRRDGAGLVLAGDGMELRCDFSALLPRIRPDRLAGELLVKAARVKGLAAPSVFDATAGLGEDSFLLAAAGCDVTLCEANPVIAALLEDGLARAMLDERLAPVAARMHLVQADSIEVLKAMAAAHGLGSAAPSGLPSDSAEPACAPVTMSAAVPDSGGIERGDTRDSHEAVVVPAATSLSGDGEPAVIPATPLAELPLPDVVYLDPMFPARQKSAAVKKKFQLLHHLECPCANEGELMAAALAVRPRKVVVKRPPKAPCLAGVKPSHCLEGKAVRYDCIVPAQLKR